MGWSFSLGVGRRPCDPETSEPQKTRAEAVGFIPRGSATPVGNSVDEIGSMHALRIP